MKWYFPCYPISLISPLLVTGQKDYVHRGLNKLCDRSYTEAMISKCDRLRMLDTSVRQMLKALLQYTRRYGEKGQEYTRNAKVRRDQLTRNVIV